MCRSDDEHYVLLDVLLELLVCVFHYSLGVVYFLSFSLFDFFEIILAHLVASL